MELAVASRRLSKTLAFCMKNWPKESRILALGFQYSSFIGHGGVIKEEKLLFPKRSVYLYPCLAS